jgi:hypothetical protein
MNIKSEDSGFSSSLSPSQIETLQHQIRQFKTLGKRFNDSHLPKLIEEINQGVVQTVVLKSTEVEEPNEIPTPVLSWQCFNALLFYGPPKPPQDGNISFSPTVSGFLICIFIFLIEIVRMLDVSQKEHICHWS